MVYGKFTTVGEQFNLRRQALSEVDVFQHGKRSVERLLLSRAVTVYPMDDLRLTAFRRHCVECPKTRFRSSYRGDAYVNSVCVYCTRPFPCLPTAGLAARGNAIQFAEPAASSFWRGDRGSD